MSNERYFPKELWFIIKSYEFQLNYPRCVQIQALETLKFHIAMPFVLGLDKDKYYPEQLAFIKQNQPQLWNMFSHKYLSGYIGLQIYKNIRIY